MENLFYVMVVAQGLLMLVILGAAGSRDGSNSFVHEELHISFMSPLACSCSACEPERSTPIRTGNLNPGILPAVLVARDHINENGSYLSGRILSVDVIQPQECDRKQALDVFHSNLFNVTSPPMLAMIGAGCSIASEAVAEISQYYNLILMSFVSSSISLDNRDKFQYFFRTIPSDSYLSSAMTAIISTYNWTRVAVISQGTSEFLLFREYLMGKLNEKNVTIIRNDLLPRNLSNASTADLFAPDVRIVVLNMDPGTTRAVLCEALQRLHWRQHRYVWLTQGWYQDNWWKAGSDGFGGDTICSDDDMLEFLRRQRVLGVIHYLPPSGITTPTTYGVTTPSFKSDYLNRLQDESDYTSLVYFAYDAMWALVLALSDLGPSVYQFNPLNITQENRELGKMIRDTLDSLTFTGVSGTVEFANGSRVTDKVDIFQYQQSSMNPKLMARVYFDNGSAQLNEREPLWPRSNIPSDGSPYTVEQYPFIWLVVCAYVFSSLNILVAVLCLIFNFVFRNRKLIRLSSPNLNYIIGLGCIVMSCSAFFYAYPPLSRNIFNAYCGFRSWLASIGYSLCFGTINAKMWRVYYIFNNPRPTAKKKPLKDIYLVLCVLVFLAIDITILLIVSPLKDVRLEATTYMNKENPTGLDDEGIKVLYVVTLCEARWKSLWSGVLFGYKVIMQAIGVFLAFKIRKVKIKVLNDSKEVVATLYLSSIILLVVIIITLFFGEYLNVYTAGFAFGILLSNIVVLGVVFISKMVRLYKDPTGSKLFTQGTHNESSNGTLAMTVDDQKIATLHRKIQTLEDQVCTLQQTQTRGDSVASNGKHVQIFLTDSQKGGICK